MSDESSTSDPKRDRLNVAVSPDTRAAIEQVARRDGVSITEAVGRLISYGAAMHRVAKIENRRVLFANDDGTTQEVILL